MKTSCVRIAVALGASMLLSRPAAAQSVMLKPAFQAGQKFYTEYTNQGTQEIKGSFAGPNGMTINVTQIEGMLCEVKSASPDATELQMTWDRVAQLMDFAMMPAKFDSDKDDPKDVSNQAAVALGPKLGMSITLKLGPDGRVVECSGMDKVLAKLEEEALGVTLFEQQRASLTNEHTASLWSVTLAALYPNREVKPGDTWTNRVPFLVPQMGEMTYVFNCKADQIVEEAGRKYLIVSYDGIVEIPDEMKTKPNQMGMVLREFDGKHQGSARYDIELGQFASQRADQTLNMVLGIAGSEPTTQPADDPSRMEFVMRMRTDALICSVAEREKLKAANRAAAAEASESEDADEEDDE